VTVVHGFSRAVSLASVAIGLCLTAAVGCVGGDAPDDEVDAGAKAGSGGSGGTGGSKTDAGSGGANSTLLKAGAADSHFPLVDRATWTYRHEYPQNPGKTPWDEIANMHATTYMDKPAFILEDEEDAQGERSASTMVIDGNRILRVYKQVKVADQEAFNTTYDPGFLRYDEAWADFSGDPIKETYKSVQTCVMASTASKCAPGAIKRETTVHTFKVLDEHAEITVAAGKFDTVQIERINIGDPDITGDEETKHFWYAKGVGKVRELDVENGATEELSSFDIP
jgi:hypothetical protein